jgi:hypothetical protein
MKVVYTEKAKQRGEGLALVQHATQRLEEIVPSTGPVVAEWDRTEDHTGRPRYLLKLSGFDSEVRDEFAPDELASDPEMGVRLSRLWGDLLQVRSHKLIQELIGGQPEK